MGNQECKISSAMEKLIAGQEMAGAAMIVRKNGQELYRGCWGYADIEKRIPVNNNTKFCLCSMTKPVAAVAVMQLEEQGLLQLDTPVSNYFPWLADRTVCELHIKPDGTYVPTDKYPAGLSLEQLENRMEYIPAKKEITICHLLTHCSGIGSGPIGMRKLRQIYVPNGGLQDQIAAWKDIPLDFQPESMAEYSPLAGFDLLAGIVEKVSGESYREYVGKHIIEPLHSGLIYPYEKQVVHNLSVLYKRADKRLEKTTGKEEILGYMRNSGIICTGSAGLYGSVEDYDRITTMLAREGELDGVRILKKETVRRMHSAREGFPLEMIPGTCWGLGMLMFQAPGIMDYSVKSGTYGWSGAYGTHMFIEPESHLGVTFVMNRSNIGGADSFIARLVERLVFHIYMK